MQKDILSLAKKFISIASTTDNTQALVEILELALSHLKGFAIERFNSNGIKSALIYNRKTRPKQFQIILNAHLDVIPGKDHQYVPRLKGSKLYGPGSMDMKASAACLIYAFEDVANKVAYPLGLQLVTDEETGGFDGTKYQIKKDVRAKFALAGEPTNFDIVYKAKGVLQVKVSTAGHAAHGAYPWNGENAIWRMTEFLGTLEKKYPIPSRERWETTLNLSAIETTNQALNRVPDDCTIRLDIRFIPEETDTIVRSIEQILPKGFSLEIVAKESALLTDQNDEHIRRLVKIANQTIGKTIALRGAHGTSDARHFSRVNCPGIEFGPIGDGIGSDDEWVDIPSLETYHQILKNFLLSLKD